MTGDTMSPQLEHTPAETPAPPAAGLCTRPPEGCPFPAGGWEGHAALLRLQTSGTEWSMPWWSRVGDNLQTQG